EVASHRLQDVLPRTDCAGVTHEEGFAAACCLDEIRNEPILGPVASTDDVAGARRCDCHAMSRVLGGREEGTAVGCRHQLGATLAAAVRVVAPHGLVFAVAPHPFAILVALVACHADDSPDAFGCAHRLENMRGSHDVGGI